MVYLKPRLFWTLNPPGGYTGKIGIPIPATDIKILDDEGNELAMARLVKFVPKVHKSWSATGIALMKPKRL